MAVLKILTGDCIGRELSVSGARTTLGRHPQCEIVLENAAISRQHAQILLVGRDYFIEDLTSRNGTFLNGYPLEGRTPLSGGDELQLSDMRLQFISSGDSVNAEMHAGGQTDDSYEIAPTIQSSPKDSSESGTFATDGVDGNELVIETPSGMSVHASQMIDPIAFDDAIHPEDESFAAQMPLDILAPLSNSNLPLGPESKATGEDTDRPGDLAGDAAAPDGLDASSIIHKLPAHDTVGPKSRTATKLKAVLEIARALTRVLDIDQVLPRTLQTLFRTFPQAEQGYILLQDRQTGRLKVKASQARSAESGGQSPDHVAVSMTVVRRAMETGEAVITSNALDDTRFKASTSVSSLRIRSIMCVPLIVFGSDNASRTIGVIQLDTRQADEEFDEEDLELIAAVAAQVAQAVENAEMHRALLTRREMERDLEFATQVQRGFLPNERPQVEKYSFSDYYEAAKSVGGDYYDYIRTPEDQIAVVLGDVAGKGVSAALLMARLYSSARYQFLTNNDPAVAVTKLNEDIVDSGMGGRFITFVAMLLDPVHHRLTLANAGHMPPLLRTPDGTVIPISKDVSSVPLGITPENEYRSMTIDFPPGSSVLAFTDGITEAMNKQKVMYGKNRLIKRFGEVEGDIGDSIRAIIRDVDDHSEGTIDRDDTCLVGVQHRP